MVLHQISASPWGRVGNTSLWFVNMQENMIDCYGPPAYIEEREESAYYKLREPTIDIC